MFGLGLGELVVILLVVLVLFGSSRLPELGSGLGSAIKNFKKEYREANAIDVTPSGQSAKPQEPSSEASKSEKN